mgnify:CR=1 FL=1
MFNQLYKTDVIPSNFMITYAVVKITINDKNNIV